MPRVNPEILRWARETAGLDLEDAAAKIDLGTARGVAGADRLAAMEAGETEPTRPLLLRMAKQYRRPLVAFYLSATPRKGNRGQDFRTLPDGSSDEDEAALDALLRDFLSRQALVRAALEEEEREPLSWIGSAAIGNGVATLTRKIREALNLDLATFRAARTVDDAFNLLRQRVEDTGTFVVLASNLGSYHTTLGVDVFRGLAVADRIAPLIVINDQDSRTAWSFTLLHELAHLWLGYTGVSGGTFDRDVEQFCNAVASEFLLPPEELQQFGIQPGSSLAQMEEAISQFARARMVSRSMIAYRLYQHQRISEDQWRTLSRSFRRQWLKNRDRQRIVSRESEGGGPTYYVLRRHRLGRALVTTTARLLSSGGITTVKAAHVLGVRPNNVGPLISGVPVAARGAA